MGWLMVCMEQMRHICEIDLLRVEQQVGWSNRVTVLTLGY
jgi:hypothetical protein